MVSNLHRDGNELRAGKRLCRRGEERREERRTLRKLTRARMIWLCTDPPPRRKKKTESSEPGCRLVQPGLPLCQISERC